MRKVVLSTLAAAALTFDVLPDSNIAYRRAVYQSSAADFTHVGHLVTDGVKSAEPLQITETRVELPGKSPDNERAKCATDGRADTKWVVFAPSCWIEVVLPSPAKATSYSVTTANDESRRDPKVWRVLGSADGKKYVELASMDDPKFHRRHERKTWNIDRPGDYRFYRFAIDSNGGGVAQDRTTPCTQIAEFDVLDADGKSLVRSGGEEGFASRWVSKTGRDEWLKIDLGAPSRVDSVKVDWTKGGEAAEWRIELSSDGGTVELSDQKASPTVSGVKGEVTVSNTSDRPRLLVSLKLVDAKGRRVLPVHWSDNFFSLLPGESRRKACGDSPRRVISAQL